VTTKATLDAPARANGDRAANDLPDAVQGMQLRKIRLEEIVIPDERHKRRSRRHRDGLGSSMDAIGLDNPIQVSPMDDGRFALVAGEGRLAEAQAKGW